MEAPVLAYPNSEDLFILDTDASNHAIGSELLQAQNRALILGERISAITLTQQRKQWLSVELNRWCSERINCYF